MVGCRRRRLELNDIDLADSRVFAAGEADCAQAARIPQSGIEFGVDEGGGQQREQQNESQGVHLVVAVTARFLCRKLDAKPHRNAVDEIEVADDQRQVENILVGQADRA